MNFVFSQGVDFCCISISEYHLMFRAKATAILAIYSVSND